MRIGFLTSVPITIQSFFLEWIEAWTARGWTIHAAAGGPRPDGLVAASYTDIDGLGQNPSARSARGLRSLAAWRSEHELDIVIVNTAMASALYRLLPRDSTKTVYFCHGLHFGDRPESAGDRAYWLAERALVARTDAAIVMNSADLDFFTRHLDTSRVHMLGAGVGLDTEHWEPQIRCDGRPAEAAAEPGMKLVWMGMFTSRKRPGDAVRALEVIRHRADPTATLSMLGDGPLLDEVKSLANELGLADAITFTGQVDPGPSLAASDVLIHTAEWEGYCRTLMEASFIGLPAVSYDVKGCRDVFGVEAVGNPGDVHALSRAVLEARQSSPALEGRPDYSWRAAFDSTNRFLADTFGQS